MPFITYEGPALRSQEKREELIRELTRVVAQSVGVAAEDVVILIKEQGGPHMTKTAQAVSVGGKFVAERSP